MSSATTSASRARAAERYAGPVTRDGRRPSEQWLGKPYDPQQERTKRKIPELGKIDFEARRERIQKAISQNLEEQRSLETLRTRSGSRQASQEQDGQATVAGAEEGALNIVDEHQAEEMDRETDSMPGGWPTPLGLSVDTFELPKRQEQEPVTNSALTERSAYTEFELDESPILGRPSAPENKDPAPQAEQPAMLTAATYQRPPAKVPAPIGISPVQEVPAEEVQSPSVLENVMRMRQHGSSQASRSEMDDADDSAPGSADDSPSDVEERWGLPTGLTSVNGSIRIMLDEDPMAAHQAGRSWSRSVHDEFDHINTRGRRESTPQVQPPIQSSFDANSYSYSPIEEQEAFPERQRQPTPRRDRGRDNTITPSDFQQPHASATVPQDATSDPALARAIEQYQTHGTISPDMLEQMQKHMVDLQRLSANEGSNGFMIQSLLDSILDVQKRQDESDEPDKEVLPSTSYEMPLVTPDTPPDWGYTDQQGTAVVYSNDDASYEVSPAEDGDEDDFHVKIRKADEAWERQQRGSYLRLELGDEDRPAPPPKDAGYTPRSSIGPG